MLQVSGQQQFQSNMVIVGTGLSRCAFYYLRNERMAIINRKNATNDGVIAYNANKE